MKKTVILSLLLLSFISVHTKSKKLVIGGRIGCGFFSNFLGVLNNLHWCEKTHKIPVVYWPKEGLYYDPRGCNGIISDNIWDYYFYPVSVKKYRKGDKIKYSPFPSDGFCVQTHPNTPNPYPDTYYRNYMNRFIKKYIRIKDATVKKIDDFYDKNIKGKYTVSIHIRGTDKWTEVEPIPLDDIFSEANKHIPCQFFVATDEERILEEAKIKLHGDVISYNSARVKEGYAATGVHYGCTEKTKAYLGEDALIDCILLSRCDLIIHTWSNLSIAALLFNPSIPNIHLGKE